MSSMKNPKTRCQLMCASEKIFQVEIGNLRKAKVFQSMLDAFGIGFSDLYVVDPDVIPLPNISEGCMERLLPYLGYHKDDPDPEQGDMESVFNEVSEFDRRFLDSMDADLLFEMAMQAHYLEIPILRELVTSEIAKLVVKQDEERAAAKLKAAEEGLVEESPGDGSVEGGTLGEQEKQEEDDAVASQLADETCTSDDLGLDVSTDEANHSQPTSTTEASVENEAGAEASLSSTDDSSTQEEQSPQEYSSDKQ